MTRREILHTLAEGGGIRYDANREQVAVTHSGIELLQQYARNYWGDVIDQHPAAVIVPSVRAAPRNYPLEVLQIVDITLGDLLRAASRPAAVTNFDMACERALGQLSHQLPVVGAHIGFLYEWPRLEVWHLSQDGSVRTAVRAATRVARVVFVGAAEYVVEASEVERELEGTVLRQRRLSFNGKGDL